MRQRRELREHKGRIALMLLLSGIVFLAIAAAVLLTFGAMHVLTALGVMQDASEQVDISGTMKFVLCVSMVMGVILSTVTGKVSLNPLKRIIDQLDRLASGDFTARLHFGKPIGEHPAFKSIESSFNRAAEELEHTEMLRSDFINNFSHEFKTPIVSIAGFAQLLRRGNLTEAQREEYLEAIEEESLRLATLANKVLSLTHVENQTILTDVSEYNLSEQIRGAVLLLEEKWMPKNLCMNLPFCEHFISANEELLKQVWINLLDNAVKFSPPNGTVSVDISEDDAWLTVVVSNPCKDIPQDKLAYIFNKFYQADESHCLEGNGIGLAVVKKVCQLHGGEVTAASENGMTSFTVRLPRRAD